METEAAAAGFYHSPGWDRDYPKLQILTIAATSSLEVGYATASGGNGA
jgi:hypothetical protein